MILLNINESNLNTLERVATSQVVWAILCIALAIYLLIRSEKREEKLLNNNEKLIDNESKIMDSQKEISRILKDQSDTQKEVVETMKDLSKTVNKIEFRVERLEKPMRAKND